MKMELTVRPNGTLYIPQALGVFLESSTFHVDHSRKGCLHIYDREWSDIRGTRALTEHRGIMLTRDDVVPIRCTAGDKVAVEYDHSYQRIVVKKVDKQ